MWKAITYVTSGFTLVAFVVAAVVLIIRSLLQRRERLILTAPESERADLVRRELEFFAVDPSGLTKAQQYQLALEQIRARMTKFKITATVVILVSMLAAGLTAFALVKDSTKSASTTDNENQIVDPTPSEAEYLLSGFVRDERGPVANVEVIAGTKRTTSDSNGAFALNVRGVKYDLVRLVAIKAGFETFKDDFQIRPEDSITITLKKSSVR